MRLLKPLTLTLLTTSTLFAQTTMCFKENHNSMSTIENTKLDGGECKSIYTVKEMKKNGWNVDDIKITTTNKGKYNFIYIFKNSKSSSNFINVNSNLTSEELEAKIIKKLEAKKEQERKEQEIKRKIDLKEKGQKIYTKKCQTCHGSKGEIEAYNSSKKLNSLSLEEIQDAVARYTNSHEYGNGNQFIMRPYAASVNNNELEAIYQYLNSINK
ncbi:c-type cytochrome [Arcobacter sp. YIC-80]|uniref:c-type cytochrome n=1 Tax=Arcobacter sp. YIC-80 TaxID=3376683 RepID=UPI00384EB5A8